MRSGSWPTLTLAAAIVFAPAAPAFAQASEEQIQAQERRQSQLTLHQALGLATLTSMAVTAGLGMSLQRGWVPDGVHLGAAALTTGLYLGSAGLALTAPPRAFDLEQEGWDTSVIHRNLAWVHGAGIATTVGLGLATYLSTPGLSNVHGAFAFGTLGVMALSAGVIAFGY